MPTYREIQEAVEAETGCTVKTCWIAEVKERLGLPVRQAWNRRGARRENPCPPHMVEIIAQVIRELQKT